MHVAVPNGHVGHFDFRFSGIFHSPSSGLHLAHFVDLPLQLAIIKGHLYDVLICLPPWPIRLACRLCSVYTSEASFAARSTAGVTVIRTPFFFTTTLKISVSCSLISSACLQISGCCQADASMLQPGTPEMICVNRSQMRNEVWGREGQNNYSSQ